MILLGIAGICFVLALVGLVTPGIPTVPFVLATSYCLVRSSPALDRRLRQSKTFGPLVREWEAHRGMSRRTKGKATCFTLALVGATIVVAGPSAPLLFVMGVMAAIGIGLVYWLPTVPEIPHDDASG